MWHSEFKLHLYPANPQYATDKNSVFEVLQALKFIGKKIASNRYATGDSFVSLLTFMGCSPDIELEPQKDKPYCYIEFESFKQAMFISGQNTQYPACPNCQHKLTNIVCSRCSTTIDPTKFNWRKSAFIASNCITIGNIYELEAIPSDQLLNALEDETGVKWKPAYIRHNPNQEAN